MGASKISNNGFIVVDTQKKLSLSCSETTLTVKESGRLKLECPLHQVLWVEVYENSMLRISLLHRQRSGLALWTTSCAFDPALHETVTQWTNSLMKAAYEGCQTNRRLKIIINPRGGPGKALSSWEKKVKPIFEVARCPMDVLITEYPRHCYEHIKTTSLDYDAIVLLSGDGLVHEVFNAFADREDAADAFAIPVVQIPTGSANGLSLCLLGLEDGHDVCAAALNTIKGRRMKLDLCSMQQEGKRIISFMTQAIGMMANIDLGTDNLRWMGDTRFFVGLMREVGINRHCPMKLEIKVAARDKQKMIETYRASRVQSDFTISEPEHHSTAIVETLRTAQSNAELFARGQSQSPPSPVEDTEDSEGWITIDKPLAYVYAGKLPYVTRDFMQFPVALCDDGLIDIVAQERVSRTRMLKYMNDASKGKLSGSPPNIISRRRRIVSYPTPGTGIWRLMARNTLMHPSK